jgi:hypothetical protein
MRYGPLRQIGYMLWATAADLVMHYGPLRGMKEYSKICIDFCAMGNSAGFGYLLWAIGQDLVTLWALAKDFVKHYGPWRSIWLCAMRQSAKPITIAQN